MVEVLDNESAPAKAILRESVVVEGIVVLMELGTQFLWPIVLVIPPQLPNPSVLQYCQSQVGYQYQFGKKDLLRSSHFGPWT